MRPGLCLGPVTRSSCVGPRQPGSKAATGGRCTSNLAGGAAAWPQQVVRPAQSALHARVQHQRRCCTASFECRAAAAGVAEGSTATSFSICFVLRAAYASTLDVRHEGYSGSDSRCALRAEVAAVVGEACDSIMHFIVDHGCACDATAPAGCPVVFGAAPGLNGI